MTQPRLPTPPRDRWYVLGVMTLVYALNIADRFSVSTLIEPIRKELMLSDKGIAFLTGSALAFFYVTVGIPVAALADRLNRRNILAVSLLIWSGVTALCGVARNYGQLLVARFAVGIGEAGGTPPSTSIVADNFPPARRPLALTIYALGACIGAWLGSSVAGAAADYGGWRLAFLVLGVPGVAVALLVWLTVREPRRGQLDSVPHRPPAEPFSLGTIIRQLIDTLRSMSAQRSSIHIVVGGSVATFWSWGLIWWTTAFLQRSHHLTVGEAGGLLGPMHLIAGTAGTLCAGVLMGLPAARDPRFVTRLLACVMVLTTVPSFFAYQAASLRTATVMLWLFVPGVYFYIGPILGLLANVLPPAVRATSVAILLFFANLANLFVAPQLVGALSDWFAASFGAGTESLRWALLLLAPTGLWGAWHIWRAGGTIREDEARAT
jgi:predicted MFS family arabinose efflux permease